MEKRAKAIAATQTKADANMRILRIAGSALLGLTLVLLAGFAQAAAPYDLAPALSVPTL